MSQLVDYVRTRLEEHILLVGTSSADVAKWFDAHRADYDAALLSAMSFLNETDAWLARTAVESGTESFQDLAWSLPQADPQLPLGGALGWHLRRELSADLAGRVFGEAHDELVGPLLVGSTFHLYRVWERRAAALTPAMESLCRKDYVAHRATQARSTVQP
jgi:hypothetical protein